MTHFHISHAPRPARSPLHALAAAAAAFTTLTTPCALAQDRPAPAGTGDRIVVLGSREPAPLETIAADVVLIDGERLRQSVADSIEDLLRREAGLQLSRNGGPGSNAGLFIRGAASGNTVVLVDGVRVGSATLGLAGFEGLSLAQVERIEVLRGPGSSLYGADAVGGVVQIFTHRGQPGAPRVAARAALGTLGAYEGSLALGGSRGAFDGAVSLSAEGNDAVSALRPGDAFGNYNPDDDGFRRRTVQAQAGWRPVAGHRIGAQVVDTRLNARYDSSEYDADFNQDPSPDFRNRQHTQVASLDHAGQWSANWVTRARLARHRDDLDTGGTTIDHFLTRRDQAELQATWRPAAGHSLTAALEHLKERADAAGYTREVSRSTDAVVLAYAGAFGDASVQVDLRRDDNSVYGSVDTGRLAAAWAVAPGWRVRAVAGTTFKAPSFNDLYYPGYGVDTLQPERGRSIEAGLDWRRGAAEASATVYRNRVRDLVAYESNRDACPADPSYDFGCARNINRARLQGLTLSAAQAFGALQLRATLDLLDAEDEATGDRLARRAPHQAHVDARWQLGEWILGASLLHLAARPDGGTTLAAETTLDLQARWQLAPRWQLEARLLNATDRDTEPVLDYQGLGRQAWLGLRYQGAGL